MTQISRFIWYTDNLDFQIKYRYYLDNNLDFLKQLKHIWCTDSKKIIYCYLSIELYEWGIYNITMLTFIEYTEWPDIKILIFLLLSVIHIFNITRRHPSPLITLTNSGNLNNWFFYHLRPIIIYKWYKIMSHVPIL